MQSRPKILILQLQTMLLLLICILLWQITMKISAFHHTVYSPQWLFAMMERRVLQKEQISNVFYFPLRKSVLEGRSKEMIDIINAHNDAYEFKTANALWVREDYLLNEQYTSNVENYYDGTITPLDFMGEPEESRLIINNWVENKTNNKIKDLLAKGIFDGPIKLVITNAVYFNGTWSQEFSEATGERAISPFQWAGNKS